jgi:hypothetical protein
MDPFHPQAWTLSSPQDPGQATPWRGLLSRGRISRPLSSPLGCQLQEQKIGELERKYRFSSPTPMTGSSLPLTEPPARVRHLQGS